MQEKIHNKRHQKQCFNKGFNNFFNGLADKLGAVINNLIVHIAGKALFRLFQGGGYAAYRLHRIGPGRKADHKAGTGLAFVKPENIIAF